jgi:integrase/recombinase XerD
MNTEMVRFADVEAAFPSMAEGLRKAFTLFNSVKSFEDLEREFLKGAGLSPNTYRSYLCAVKQFYEYTNGLHPFQVRPNNIEAWYDSLIKSGLDRNTAYLRIRGLKRFFTGIRNVLPAYTSPFDVMNEKLSSKLNKTRTGNRTKAALTAEEIRALLESIDTTTTRGLQDRAIVFMLVTSGLRSAELLQLRWKDLERREGTWYARFIGKGDKAAEQELFTAAVEAADRAFKAQHGAGNPPLEAALFWTLPSFPGDQARPLTYHTLWSRVRDIGAAARKAGTITRELQFSPHLFRRSYATALYKSGMKIKAIQEKTRHASVEVLMKHYIKDTEPAAAYLDKIFSPAEPVDVR